MTALVTMELTTGNSLSQQCSSCDASSARCWCVDCNEALCDACVSAHRRVTLTRSHRILNQPPAGGVSTPPTKFCRLHPSEPLKLFCFNCNQLTCRDCQLLTHKNHRYQFVSEGVARLKKELEVLVQPVRANRERVRQSLQDMKTRLQDVVQSESLLKTELKSSFRTLFLHLKKRMDDILKESEMVCKSECDKIHIRMRTVKELYDSQQTVIETAKEAQKSSELTALLDYKAQIESQLKKLVDQDTFPPPTMSQLKVVTDSLSLDSLLKFGHLDVTWIPFSVAKTTSQNRDTPAATAASSLQPTCGPLPQTRTTCYTDPPVPVNPPSESQQKNLVSQDTPPPPSMSHATKNVLLRKLLECGQLSEVSWIPFFVSQTSNQTKDSPTATTSSLQLTCGPLPQTRATCNTDPPVPVSPPSDSSKPASSQLSVTQPKAFMTTTSEVTCTRVVKYTPCSTVTTLSHLTGNPAKVLVLNSLSGSFQPSAAPPCTGVQLVTPSLVFNPRAALHQNPPANILVLPTNHQPEQVSCWPQFPMMLSQPQSSTFTSQNCPTQNTVSSKYTSSDITPPTSTCLSSSSQPLPPTWTTNDSGSDGALNCFSTSQNSLLCPRPSSCPLITPSGGTLPQSENTCDTDAPIPASCPSDSTESSSAPLSINQPDAPGTQTVQQISSSTSPNCQPTEEKCSTARTSPVSLSLSVAQVSTNPCSLKLPQQSPVVQAVADSACDHSVQPVTVSLHETEENEPTSTVSEETESAGKPAAPEVSDGDAEEPRTVIGHPDCSLSQWQPRVSLFRLPVSLLRLGNPLSRSSVVPGAAEDEIDLKETHDDPQSRVDDMEPLSSPESPVTLQIVTCSACGSASSSIICSACGRGYHRDCHIPPIGPDMWSEWICSLCQDLSDPSDPYSSERPQRTQSPCLSMLDQRRCENLLLNLLVEGCSRLSEFPSVRSCLRSMAERLTRRSSSYRTAAEFLSDIRRLFRNASQGDSVLNKLLESFQSRWMETFSSVLQTSVPMSVSSNNHKGGKMTSEEEKAMTPKKQEVNTSQVKLSNLRKRLRDFLDQVETSPPKRTKTN